MKQKTKDLLDKVDAEHDWQTGQTHSHGGTAMSSVDICRVCGLRREWFSDSQNGVSERVTFATHRNEEIPLREVAALSCYGE